MSTATHAPSGHLSLGGLLGRIVFIVLIWAGLVVGLVYYLGHVIPTAYQVNLARQEAAEKNAHEALNGPESAASAPAASSAAPATSSSAKPAVAASSASVPATSASAPAASAPAASSAAPATSSSATPAVAASSTSVPATSASAPAASAPASAASAPSSAPTSPAPAKKTAGPKELPKDIRLAGLNRTALTNVSYFYAIVTSVFCVGAILLQIFKYRHREEEEHAH